MADDALERRLDGLSDRLGYLESRLDEKTAGTASHTHAWMRRLDRRFNTLSDRVDDWEARLSSLEKLTRTTDSLAITISKLATTVQEDVDQFHGKTFKLDKRLERLEAFFETVQVNGGNG